MKDKINKAFGRMTGAFHSGGVVPPTEGGLRDNEIPALLSGERLVPIQPRFDTSKEALEERATRLAAKTNARIEIRCSGESHLRWRHIAEQVANMMTHQEPWEYMWLDRLGKPPVFKITGYKG